MNRPLVPLLIALALLWRGLLPVGVMAMPVEGGFEVRLCGLTGGSVVLDLGPASDIEPQSTMDHGSSLCPLCASPGAFALPSVAAPRFFESRASVIAPAFLRDIAPRGPPLCVVARGPPSLI